MKIGQNRLSRYSLFIALAVISSLTVSSAKAAILYGDFSDIPPGVVMYTDVTEDSGTSPVPPPLYGAPDINGNNLDFDPSAFVAVATNGAPNADLSDGQLNFGFMTIPKVSGGWTGLNNLFISEGGDYSLLGGGTAATAVGASIIASVEITHVDGVALASPITVNALSSFNANAASNPGPNFWGNSLFIDFGPALNNAGFGPDSVATKGEVVINNQLSAFSETNPNTIAFIAKKDFKIIPGGDLDPNDIPEPTALALCVLCGVGLAGRRRNG